VPTPRHVEEYDNISQQLNDDESFADDMTVASASFVGDDDRYDMSAPNTGHRKRKREDSAQNYLEQSHMLWADDLLDYFMVSNDRDDANKPDPPTNFNPDWVIDGDGHTGMHWAAAMGDVEVMKQLKRFDGSLASRNCRNETPLMRAVMFTNCQDKSTMPQVVHQLIETIDKVDHCNSTAIHHAAAICASRNKHKCSRYYLDVILNKMQELLDPEHLQRLLDCQDINGNTAMHLAAQHKARKSVRALMGRGAATDIPNNEGQTAEDLIRELNQDRARDRHPQASSSPFAPDSTRHRSIYDAFPEEKPRLVPAHSSEAAMSVESKVTPLIVEKFRELAASFDEELMDRDISEKEANRLLQTTKDELSQIREEYKALTLRPNKKDEDQDQNKAKLLQLDKNVTSLIEQQQQIRLLARAQHEEGKTNGHLNQGDDLHERASLARILNEEQTKRQNLVSQYKEALSIAGQGEKGDQYRRLISKCVGTDVDDVDENVDHLLQQLVDDHGGLQNELHAEPV
jgi:transcription factor MBP1